jgi:hypothetical protein
MTSCRSPRSIPSEAGAPAAVPVLPSRRLKAVLEGNRISRPAFRALVARRFSRSRNIRLLILYHRNTISFAHVFPFIYFSSEIGRVYDAEIRAVDVDAFLCRRERFKGADIVLFQSWFDTSSERLHRLLDAIEGLGSRPVIAFVDSFAPNDLRLGKFLNDRIDFYLKKSLFADRRRHLVSTLGDTNLVEYYSELFGMAAAPTDWQVPSSLLSKLRLCPGFVLAPSLVGHFDRWQPPWQDGGRAIDIHARIQTRGAPWYAGMRQLGLDVIGRMTDCRLVAEGRVSRAAFMRELRASRLCFSPFGYGELCWRDIEAFATGAVLVKPSMAHLETQPELFVPDRTYLPVSWAMDDLEMRIRTMLDDEERRRAMAREAYEAVSRYVRERRFLDDIAFLFAPRPAAGSVPVASCADNDSPPTGPGT